MKEIKLGLEVEDIVTGFKGIAVGRTTYLQGCARVTVMPKVGQDGKLADSADFDEPDLVVIGDGILPVAKPKPGKNGGPRPCAAKKAW